MICARTAITAKEAPSKATYLFLSCVVIRYMSIHKRIGHVVSQTCVRSQEWMSSIRIGTQRCYTPYSQRKSRRWDHPYQPGVWWNGHIEENRTGGKKFKHKTGEREKERKKAEGDTMKGKEQSLNGMWTKWRKDHTPKTSYLCMLTPERRRLMENSDLEKREKEVSLRSMPIYAHIYSLLSFPLLSFLSLSLSLYLYLHFCKSKNSLFFSSKKNHPSAHFFPSRKPP